MVCRSKTLCLLKEISLFILRFKRNSNFLYFSLNSYIKNIGLKRNKLFYFRGRSKFLLLRSRMLRKLLWNIFFCKLGSRNSTFNICHNSSSGIGSAGRLVINYFNWTFSCSWLMLRWSYIIFTLISLILLRSRPRRYLEMIIEIMCTLIICMIFSYI
jgi:hypothetical protein